jgi:predicted aspartyl protease
MLKFPYVSREGTYRPIIPLQFPLPNGGTWKTYGLIDSGAPWCLFPGRVATALGHNTSKGRLPHQMIIGGGLVLSYLHKTKVWVEGKDFLWDIYFSHDIDGWEFGVLGQEPFFSNFQITFNYPKKEILLDPLC